MTRDVFHLIFCHAALQCPVPSTWSGNRSNPLLYQDLCTCLCLHQECSSLRHLLGEPPYSLQVSLLMWHSSLSMTTFWKETTKCHFLPPLDYFIFSPKRLSPSKSCMYVCWCAWLLACSEGAELACLVCLSNLSAQHDKYSLLEKLGLFLLIAWPVCSPAFPLQDHGVVS